MSSDPALKELTRIADGQDRLLGLLEKVIDERKNTVSTKLFYWSHTCLCMIIAVMGLHIMEARKIRIQGYEIEIESQHSDVDMPTSSMYASKKRSN